MRNPVRRLLVLGATAAVVIATPVVASASDAGRGYGHHVSECAQTMGFDGVHNPGMHRGFAGWDAEHGC